jgi:hypothetical protein
MSFEEFEVALVFKLYLGAHVVLPCNICYGN